MDLEIRNFRNSIIAITNACDLPIEVKRLVFQEVSKKIQEEADKVIFMQQEKLKKEEDCTNE